MIRTKDIPLRTKKLIIQEAAGLCGFCGEIDVATLEFHHIHGKSVPDPHSQENLIYVCKNCHGKITAGQISEADVVLQKRILIYKGNPNAKTAVGARILNFIGGVNTGTIANEVHFHGKSSKKQVPTPPGSIGADAIKRNYLKHLIDRYHEFAKAEKGESYKYVIFYQAIKRSYGAKWDMIPLHLFEDACAYIQSRIDKTVLGKNRKAHGQGNYSSFLDYYEKYVSRENS
ncbi:MAG: HNH endonuclease signature motif containing protein [Deltaproteobacteria bacterium]|nr:HNH endonuclease signature motif containing protein [Deltaproteobacteria bacterium]